MEQEPNQVEEPAAPINDAEKEFNFPDVNQVSVAGILQHDPPIRWTKKGVPVTNFLLVVKPDPDSSVSDAVPRHETVVSVVVWAKQAMLCKKYLKKGSAVFIQGELQSMPNARPEEGFYPVQINAQWIQYLDKGIRVEEEDEQEKQSIENGPSS